MAVTASFPHISKSTVHAGMNIEQSAEQEEGSLP